MRLYGLQPTTYSTKHVTMVAGLLQLPVLPSGMFFWTLQFVIMVVYFSCGQL